MNIVIYFHAINEKKWLEETIYLLRKKFTFINIYQLEKFFSGEINLSNTCHLTFDDGDLSFYNNVLPVLKENGIPATLFVSPLICKDDINFWFQDIQNIKHELILEEIKKLNIFSNKNIKRRDDVISTLKCLPIKQIDGIINKFKPDSDSLQNHYNINLTQLLEIVKTGLIEVGAHTLHHPILFNEDDKTSENEISESISLLKNLIGKEIRYFAYPNGVPDIDFSGREITYLKKKGIRLAFSTEPKCYSSKDNPLSIPRLSIYEGSLQYLKIKIKLLKYWNYISIFWHPGIHKRKKFIEITNPSKIQLN